MKYDVPPTNLAGYDPTRDSDGFVWRPDKARNVIEFFCECLHLTSGRMAGNPFVPQPWQQDYLATLFGWRREDGSRRYRESLFFTPRKNGKTELGAGIALYLLCCDGEAKPEVYSAANTREQATRIFEPCSIMVRGDDTLRGMTRVIESTKRVVFPSNNGYLVAISADAATAHGKNPHGVLFDELHTQPNRRLYDGLKSGMGARTQPLFVSLTTAGCDRESICYEVWRHAVNVRDGVIRDPHFLPLLYQFEDGDDWSDVAVWRRVNPSLGVTITEQFLKEQFERASTETTYENTFRNLYLNQWTEQEVRWLSLDAWDKCGGAVPTDLDGEPCWVGLDMGSVGDLSAVVLAFPRDGKVALVPHFFVPEEGLRRRGERDRVPYLVWRDQGLLTACPGKTIGHDWVKAHMLRCRDKYQIMEVAADPWNCRQMLTELERDEGLLVNEHRQGMVSMNGPSKAFERHVLDGKVLHGGNPILRWMAGNVTIERDASENIKPVKAKSTGRIDGIVAAIMAVGRCLAANESSWYYASNGLEVG